MPGKRGDPDLTVVLTMGPREPRAGPKSGEEKMLSNTQHGSHPEDAVQGWFDVSSREFLQRASA
jgi:hypothetical protein